MLQQWSSTAADVSTEHQFISRMSKEIYPYPGFGSQALVVIADDHASVQITPVEDDAACSSTLIKS